MNCEYELFQVATWSKETVLKFNASEMMPYASWVTENGETEVEANSIDNTLKGRKVTYIKAERHYASYEYGRDEA